MLLPEFYSTCVILSVIDLSLWFAAADVTKGENSLSSSPLFDDKIGKFMPEIIHNCFARCLASCVKKNAKDPKIGASECAHICRPFRLRELCGEDVQCWKECKTLGLTQRDNSSDPPSSINASFDVNFRLHVEWMEVGGAELYAIQFKPSGKGEWLDENEFYHRGLKLDGFELPPEMLCGDVSLRVAAISLTAGIGHFSAPLTLRHQKPDIRPKLDVVMKHLRRDQPFTDEATPHRSNATLTLKFRYTINSWIFDNSDLDVNLIFHLVRCEDNNPLLDVGMERFDKDPYLPNTLVTNISGDFFYNRCQFIVMLDSVHSKKCNLDYKYKVNEVTPVSLLNCEDIDNCDGKKGFKPPICGETENFQATVINASEVNWRNPHAKVAVNITFDPIMHRNRKSRQPLYYVARYGGAIEYNTSDEKAFFGVQLRNILGNASNCGEFTGNVCKTLLPSIVIGNLSVGRLYGVMICGVIDGRNLTFPRVDSGEKRFQVRANRLQIDDNDYLPVPQATIPWGVFGALALALSGSAVFLCCAWRRRERKIRLLSKMMQRSQQEVDQRYTELPRNDLWELGRRNLIIYDDKKLGSGAFGAVFLGRLIGVAKGSKDAQSTLGVNLMRADNCDVAVKMLPEYADEVSKSEFLREISLMKTLGYHERLVNMLACVTKSEPYCLVVEYCADGDLLHFLKERCNYMLKLDEENVDYASEGCQQSFDADMVMTVKQLLQFSVQISYGLEYLSQKGFVHRDVAARNILVHDKHYAKIGDFGLCRYIYADSVNYQGKGGRLPVKWMPPEAIRHYQFTTKSDVWSFGILMFEIITLGGTPYPGLQPDDLLDFLEAGGRIGQPDNCPDKFYAIMKSCWAARPSERPEFSAIRQQLALQLEEITDEYSYLRLDAQKDYYNVADRERLEQEGKQQAVSTSDELKVESASTEQVQ